jgi:hypothetical protein
MFKLETKKETRGGYRPNAGRKKGIKKPWTTINISVEVKQGLLEIAGGKSMNKLLKESIENYRKSNENKEN